jgi:uncharacterized protein DUF4157
VKTKIYQKQKDKTPSSSKTGGNANIADNRSESIKQLKLSESIQKQGDEEELMQGKHIQKASAEEEEEPLQGKLIQRAEDEDELKQGKFTAQMKENNTGLPNNLKSGVENLSGLDMSDVKVHYNSSKPTSVQAHAYTQGSDIHVASGQEKHLPHEAWHVAQQKQGRVQPTTEIGGMSVNDDISLEKEADNMGEKALNTK